MEMRLIQRLRSVSSSEGLQIPSGLLSMLCTATGFDIRSSINTLQFAYIKSQSHDTNSSESVASVLMSMLQSGLKDVDKDLFQVWKEIFWLKESARAFNKKKRLENPLAESNLNDHLATNGDRAEGKQRSRILPHELKTKAVDVFALRKLRESEFGGGSAATGKSSDTAISRATTGHAMDVIDSVIAYGDDQLIMKGLFENYLSVRYQDPAMTRTSAGVDWLCDSDIWGGKFGDALSGGQQTLKYVPVVAGSLHLIFSSGSRPQLSWPKKVIAST